MLLKEKSNEKYVILSASRMTDMPKYYPDEIIAETEKRIAKGAKIHTLVLWTKHPKALFDEKLLGFLNHMKKQKVQLSVLLTISGMGQKVYGKRKDEKPLIFEPNAPRFEESINTLPQIIALVGKPDRVKVRIDPIIRVRNHENKLISNLELFPVILQQAVQKGVRQFVFSFLEKGVHKKVDRRMAKNGCEILPPTPEEREKTKIWLKKLEKKYMVKISACSVLGFEESRCIDGYFLEKIHNLKLPADKSEKRNRTQCACTKSIDIGGWPPKKCYTACEYCYSNAHYND
ncbi:MAG: hypothetical protein CSA05_03255 [Bacteroidia bacterium]|nr:MAG: hypothetical protein CSA05_03255 [Bacteroidia bacterium]